MLYSLSSCFWDLNIEGDLLLDSSTSTQSQIDSYHVANANIYSYIAFKVFVFSCLQLKLER